jgi:hypothetical protein
MLLALGTAGGIALAAVGIVRSGSESVASDGAIALVNGEPISREAFARFAGAVAAERKESELDSGMRERLLERMIDEELLFQRGLALGLARHEPTARRSIVAALVASIGADAEAFEPDEDSLREFYATHRERFTRPGRLELDLALVRIAGVPEALAFRRAQEIATRARAGEALEQLAGELGDPLVAPLPAGALSFETLRQYLGPSAARAAFELEPGVVGEPSRGSDGYYVFRVRERTAGEVAPFDEVRAEVRSELLRSRGDQALRDYLRELRESGDVRILETGDAPG